MIAIRPRGSAGVAVLAMAALVAGCGTALRPSVSDDMPGATQRPGQGSASRGGYYKNDGPGTEIPDIDKIPNAEPRSEPPHRFANNPYTALGRNYIPMRAISPFKERGLASWYGRLFHGQKTSSGEIYDMYGMSAAHPTLPIPSYAKVTNLRNNRSVVVRVNDRGPFHTGRVIDLSFTAAAKLGYVDAGSAQVEVELIQPQDFPRYARQLTFPTVNVATAAPILGVNDAASKATAQAPEPDGQLGAIFVQVGSFATRENAEALRNRLANDFTSLKDSIEVRFIDDTYKVRVGPYRDRADANTAVEGIRRGTAITPVIVPR